MSILLAIFLPFLFVVFSMSQRLIDAVNRFANDSQNTKSGGRIDLRLSVYGFPASQFLELEAKTDLHLPLAIERSASLAGCSESGLKR